MMIKLILFSCVTLALINCCLAFESNQLINGDEPNSYVQRLRLRFRRSAGKSLLTSGSSSSMASAGSSASASDGLISGSGKGLGFGGLDDGIGPEKLFTMTLNQIAQFLGSGQGEASLKSIIEYLKNVLKDFGTGNSGNFGQKLLNGDLASKTMKQILSTAGSSTGASSGSSGITKLLSNFANPSLSSSSAGASS